MSAVVDGKQTEALTLMRADMDRLRGRLFQALESFGLEERHCDAAKGIVRQLTYASQVDFEKHLRRQGD